MNLYVMRHGEAENIGTQYSSDGVRPLTTNGRIRIERSTNGMINIGVNLDQIVSSPLVRARQTAEIVHDRLGVATDIEFSDDLPSGDIDGIVKTVSILGPLENVMLVGHEPILSRLISVLASGSPDTELNLEPGGLCKLTVDTILAGQCATIDWFLAPSQLVSLGS